MRQPPTPVRSIIRGFQKGAQVGPGHGSKHIPREGGREGGQGLDPSKASVANLLDLTVGNRWSEGGLGPESAWASRLSSRSGPTGAPVVQVLACDWSRGGARP